MTLPHRSRPARLAALWAASLPVLAACATRPPTETGFLGRYDTLQPVAGTVRAQVLQRRAEPALAPIRHVAIAPVRVAGGADLASGLDGQEQALVTGEIERQLCFALSRRFDIAPPGSTGAARIEAVVTRIQPTGAVSSVASAALSRAIPGPGSVRLPIGQGGLGVEALARDGGGQELAAMSWSRGAGVAMDRGSLSEVGDAHRFAEAFAEDFAALLGDGLHPPRPVPEPDPCTSFGPRLDLARRAAGIGLGLHLTGGARPEAAPGSSGPSGPSQPGRE